MECNGCKKDVKPIKNNRGGVVYNVCPECGDDILVEWHETGEITYDDFVERVLEEIENKFRGKDNEL